MIILGILYRWVLYRLVRPVVERLAYDPDDEERDDAWPTR